MGHVPSRREHDADGAARRPHAALTVEDPTRRTKRRSGVAFAALLAVACIGFIALGVWQLERRIEKHEQIARVESRVHAPVVDAPGPTEWAGITRDRDEYRHVLVAGRWQPDRDTLVTATTTLGSGFWVLTPLLRDDGTAVLVNRGFVTPEQVKAGVARETGQVSVAGLLRITEPHGGFLRSNDPGAGRWYSRDVAAIAQARGLGPTAPYFVDAEADAAARQAADGPVPGLTVVVFPDNHLQYAITWFVLAALCVVGEVARRRHAPRD